MKSDGVRTSKEWYLFGIQNPKLDAIAKIKGFWGIQIPQIQPGTDFKFNAYEPHKFYAELGEILPSRWQIISDNWDLFLNVFDKGSHEGWLIWDDFNSSPIGLTFVYYSAKRTLLDL